MYTSAVGIDIDVLETGGAERFRIHVAAAVPPEIEFPALAAEGNVAAVAEDDGGDVPAYRACRDGVLYDNHGTLPLHTGAKKPQETLYSLSVRRTDH